MGLFGLFSITYIFIICRIEDGLPLYSWSKAFVEAMKFSFIKAIAADSLDLEEFLVEKVCF